MIISFVYLLLNFVLVLGLIFFVVGNFFLDWSFNLIFLVLILIFNVEKWVLFNFLNFVKNVLYILMINKNIMIDFGKFKIIYCILIIIEGENILNFCKSVIWILIIY